MNHNTNITEFTGTGTNSAPRNSNGFEAEADDFNAGLGVEYGEVAAIALNVGALGTEHEFGGRLGTAGGKKQQRQEALHADGDRIR